MYLELTKNRALCFVDKSAKLILRPSHNVGGIGKNNNSMLVETAEICDLLCVITQIQIVLIPGGGRV